MGSALDYFGPFSYGNVGYRGFNKQLSVGQRLAQVTELNCIYFAVSVLMQGSFCFT